MLRDPIVEEVDQARRALLAGCGNDLDALLQGMADENEGRAGRVSSRQELDRRFPPAPLDVDGIAALGEPWRDPVVEEVHRVRERLAPEQAHAPAGGDQGSRSAPNVSPTPDARKARIA